MEYISLFTIVSVIATILVVWFETDAIAEYINLFGEKVLRRDTQIIPADLRTLESSWISGFGYVPLIHLPEFLKNRFGHHFIIKIITCPKCLGFWLSVIFTVTVMHSIVLIPVSYIASLIVYNLAK